MEPISRPRRLGDVTGTVEDAAHTAGEAVHSAGEEATPNDLSPLVGPEPASPTFDEFYRSHAGPVGQALELTLGDRELAEDALNEAMARALQRWKRVAHFDNPEGWVYRVAMNWALSWLRRRRRDRDHPRDALAVTETSLGSRDQDLEQAMAALSVEHRSVVVCRFFLDWSVKQTAESLDIAEGTVKSRLARALENIRTELEGSA